MDENKLKAIVEEAINTAVNPIKTILEDHTKRFGRIDDTLEDHTRRLDKIDDTLEEHTKILEDHSRRLEAIAGDTEQLIQDVKGARDKDGMYHSRNKREIDEIKKHIGLPLISDVPEV